MIARIMAAGNGAHLHHLIGEIYVLDLKDLRIAFMAIDWPDVNLKPGYFTSLRCSLARHYG